PSKNLHRMLLAVVLVTIGLFGICFFRLISSPRVVFLFPKPGAKWIGFDEPFRFAPRQASHVMARFRKTIAIDQVPQSAILTVYALQRATVNLDGNILSPSDPNPHDWKTPFVLNLTNRLVPGSHVLEIEVLNKDGPVAL